MLTTRPKKIQSNHKWLAMLGIGLGVLMATIDSSIVNISLPTLVEYFDTTFATIQWVILSYVLILTSFMLGAARLGDIYGKKKMYSIGLWLFIVGSLLCGTSKDVGWLIRFRALQGVGATMMQALGIAIITEVFPVSERGRALGIMGSIISVGIAMGPPLGGLLIGLYSWNAIFLVNIPLGLLTVFVVYRYVPSSDIGKSAEKFDIIGAVALLVTLTSYALGLTIGQQSGFNSSSAQGLLIVAVFGLGFFIIIEKQKKQPMIKLSLFRNILMSINLLMGFLVFLPLAGMFIMPFFLEVVKQYPITQVGLMMMVTPVSMGLVAPLAGGLSDRFGSRGISLIGLVLIATGCFLVSTLSVDSTPIGYILRLIPFGIGLGMFMSPNNSAIMGAAPREHMGVVSGLLALSRTLGQTSGLPLMGSIFTSLVLLAGKLPAGTDATTASPQAVVAGINGTYRSAAWMILAATALAVVALWLDRRRGQQELSAIN
jgi:EmrB/QacA subfamily drug resistance transporter